MTTSADTHMARPLPEPTDISLPHWEGCRRGQLLFQRCQACSKAVFPPAVICPYCSAAALLWEPSSGVGTVYSYTVVWRPQLPIFDVPYVVAVVQLQEGWHMFSNIVSVNGSTAAAPDSVQVGMPVKVTFIEVEGVMLPYFEAQT